MSIMMRSSLLLSFVLLVALAGAPGPAVAQSYQGFGADTAGGAGRPTVRVTSLADSGPGSLREAVSAGNRTVVFDVAGDIVLRSPLFVQGAFITLDGSTAPPPGITLRNYGLILRLQSVSGRPGGAHDVVVRGLRVRDAAATTSTDCIQVAWGAYNLVIDHVSVSGCGDGAIDVTNGAHDVTISWSILAEPASGKTMLIKYNARRISLHHNVFVKGLTRNPQAGVDDVGTPAADTTLDMRNNIVWDWAGGYGTLVRNGAWANVVANYYGDPGGGARDREQALIVCKGDGVETPESFALCGNGNPASAARGYVTGNLSADGVDLDAAGNQATAFSAPPVDTADACRAARQVAADAGVRPLDTVDTTSLSGIVLPACPGLSSTTTALASSPNPEGSTSPTLSGAVNGTGGQGEGKRRSRAPAPPSQLDLRAILAPCCESLEPDAKGELRHSTRLRKRRPDQYNFSASVRIPIPSPTLGLHDATGAGAAVVSVLLSRSGTPYADCVLAADEIDADDDENESRNEDEDEDQELSARYSLRLRLFLKKGVWALKADKGYCDTDLAAAGIQNGMPNVQTGDVATVTIDDAAAQGLLLQGGVDRKK